jgi:hypothetical protein
MKGGVEATAKEGTRAGRSGGAAFHEWFGKRKRGCPCRAVRGKTVRGWKRDQWNGVPDRDAGVGGELFESFTMPRLAALSRGSPVIVRKIITHRFVGVFMGS